MAKRVIGICNGAPSAVDRKQLPESLCEALQRVASSVEGLGFDLSTLQPSKWVWDWNPDYDGPFTEWLLGKTVGLSWPNAEGVSVLCSHNLTLVSTGVHWDILIQDVGIREAVTNLVIGIGRSIGASEAWLIPDSGDAAVSKILDMVFEDAPSFELAEMVKRSTVVHALRC